MNCFITQALLSSATPCDWRSWQAMKRRWPQSWNWQASRSETPPREQPSKSKAFFCKRIKERRAAWLSSFQVKVRNIPTCCVASWRCRLRPGKNGWKPTNYFVA